MIPVFLHASVHLHESLRQPLGLRSPELGEPVRVVVQVILAMPNEK